MKAISAAMAAHLASDTTSLTTCWKISRVDGTVMGFTELDQDLVIGGVTYHAATGYTRTAIAGRADLSVDNLNVEGLLDSTAIRDDELRAGLYDGAALEIFMVNWNDLSMGEIRLRTGWLGEVKLQDGQFSAEIRGLAQLLTLNAIRRFTPSCTAQLGDGKCKIDMTPFTDTGTVTAVSDPRRSFSATLSSSRAAGAYAGGLLDFTSGANALAAPIEVKSWNGTAFTLYLPFGYNIAVGDAFTVTVGCAKTPAACKTFNNFLNYRGFPHIPGLDALLMTPRATSSF